MVSGLQDSGFDDWSELFRPGSAEWKAIQFLVHPQWLGDGHRLLGGDNRECFVTGYDIKAIRRLKVLLLELPNGEYIAIGPDGNYKGVTEMQ